METCKVNFYIDTKRCLLIQFTAICIRLSPPPFRKEKNERERPLCFAVDSFLGRADVTKLLISSKADIFGLQVTTPETTEFSSIITRICVLLHFAGKQHLYCNGL